MGRVSGIHFKAVGARYDINQICTVHSILELVFIRSGYVEFSDMNIIQYMYFCMRNLRLLFSFFVLVNFYSLIVCYLCTLCTIFYNKYILQNACLCLLMNRHRTPKSRSVWPTLQVKISDRKFFMEMLYFGALLKVLVRNLHVVDNSTVNTKSASDGGFHLPMPSVATGMYVDFLLKSSFLFPTVV